MDFKEAAIKHVFLFILLGATSYWVYTNTGEPIVGIVSVLGQFVYLYYDYKKSKQIDKPKEKDQGSQHKSISVGDISQNSGTIHIINSPSSENPQTLSNIEFSQLFAAFTEAVAEKSDFKLKKFKYELEFAYSYILNGKNVAIDPRLRKLYDDTIRILTTESNFTIIILMLVGIFYLISFIINFIKHLF